MLFFGIKNFWFKLCVFLVPSILAALYIGWMYESQFVIDPYDPKLTGTERYGHNFANDFQSFAVLTLIQYFVLLMILLPFSFRRYYWVRPLFLQFLFGFWLLLEPGMTMHSGNVVWLHLRWVGKINIFIFVLLIASITAEVFNVIRNRANQNQ